MQPYHCTIPAVVWHIQNRVVVEREPEGVMHQVFCHQCVKPLIPWAQERIEQRGESEETQSSQEKKQYVPGK